MATATDFSFLLPCSRLSSPLFLAFSLLGMPYFSEPLQALLTHIPLQKHSFCSRAGPFLVFLAVTPPSFVSTRLLFSNYRLEVSSCQHLSSESLNMSKLTALFFALFALLAGRGTSASIDCTLGRPFEARGSPTLLSSRIEHHPS